jgi:antitoxin ParD1/3/4
MPRNASVTLGSHFDSFVNAQVSSGVFCTRSEVVRAGLSLLEEHQNKVIALKSAIAAGLASESVETSYEQFMEERKETGRKA